MADSKKYNPRIPIDYQELVYISNSGTQYIDTGLKGSDLADCEVEIVMRNDTTDITSYNFNGTYLSGSTAQFGLVATSGSECRSSISFGFTDAIRVTGLDISEFHTIYVTNGLQKVDNTVVGTLNFGTLNDGNFLLFARTDPNVASGVSICAAMSLKSFTVKRNNQYIRNMIPVRRISDSVLGLYDAANDVFYTNQSTGTFTAGSEVNNWQHSLRKLGTSTDTLTTLPSDLYADGTNATVGLVGNMSQTGTPTPTTPIQPQECGERTGNLFDYTKTDGIIANKYINQSGAIVADNEYYISYPIKVNVGETYTWRFDSNSSTTGHTAPTVGFYDSSDNLLSTAQHNVKVKYFSFEVPANCAYIRASVFTRSNAQKEAMLNTGSTPLPYEPYGYKIPISSANTTTPVYLGEVETTRKIKKYEFTGNENWVRTSSGYFYSGNAISDYNNRLFAITTLCSHYMSVINATNGSALNDGEMCLYSSFSGSAHEVYIKDNAYSTAEDFKTYLQQQYSAGTPVTVWYVLATPTTGIVNEPLRKIGNYADTVSGITIPTITGKDTFDVETTLKPSEVSLNYTGWHDAEVKEWDGSEWQ